MPKEGDSITVLNEQTTYNTWEFIYDPRIEQLYAKASVVWRGFAASSGLGSASGQSLGVWEYADSGLLAGSGTTPGSSELRQGRCFADDSDYSPQPQQ